MSGFYGEIETFVGPGCELTRAGLIRPLVRVRLSQVPGRADAPAAFTDLRVDDARHLACELAAAAAHAAALAAPAGGEGGR